MIVYKLTDADGYCRCNRTGETLYEVGKTYTADGNGNLCTEHWRHAYEHPLLAVLHDPIHAHYGNTSRMWECDTLDGIIKKDGMMKLGTTKLKVLREIDKPQVTLEQRVAYAISCSLRVYIEESYVEWAENWLSGKDRSRESARTAVRATVKRTFAEDSAYGAAEAAANALGDAVWEAARAAEYATSEAEKYGEIHDLLDCAREVLLIP